MALLQNIRNRKSRYIDFSLKIVVSIPALSKACLSRLETVEEKQFAI